MTIFGSDVSHYDAPDTRAMFREGIVFQTHKAGGDSNDTELATWWNLVKDMTLPPSGRAGSTGPTRPLLGAYWVLYPGRPGQRADEFIARLDSQCPGWRDRPFILQVDCERWNGNQATVPPVSDINAFCDHLVARMPKLNPIGYLPDWAYGNISAFRYPLWSSKYVTGAGGFRQLYPGDDAKQWAAYGGKSPDVLQYTSSATIGGQTTCDANAYRGTLDQLTALLAPGWHQEENMTIADADAEKIADKVWGRMFTRPDGPDGNGNKQTSAGAYQCYNDKVTNDAATRVINTLTPIIKGVDTDETAVAATVVQGVLAGLAGSSGAAETIAGAVMAALPPELARQVADEIGKRLSSQ